MAGRSFFQPLETKQRADALLFSKKAQDDIWGLGFSQGANDDITALGDHLQMPDPLPVVVSDRPDALKLQQQQQASASSMAMPSSSSPSQAGAPSSGTPSAMPQQSGGSVSTATVQTGAPSDIDNSSREAFARTAYPAALRAAGGDPELAKRFLAMAISENGTVGSGGAIGVGNNFGGIKYDPQASGSGNYGTWESEGGQRVNQNADFAAYASVQDGFDAIPRFIQTNMPQAWARYQQTHDAAGLIRDINAAGYATNPTWFQDIESIAGRNVAPALTSASAPDMQKVGADVPETGMSAGDQKRAKLSHLSSDVSPDVSQSVTSDMLRQPLVPTMSTPRPGTDQPIVNPDGSVTTERSITVTDNRLNGGRATNIPTVWNGRIVSDDEAIDNAARSGIAWPSFNSIDEAEAAAVQRSKDLGAGRATSVGGAQVPPEVQNAQPYRNRAVRGEPIDESGGTMYRQPLVPTMGDTATGDYDPRDADQGAHESGYTVAGAADYGTQAPVDAPTALPPAGVAPGAAPSSYGASGDDPGQAPASSPYTVVPSDAPLASDQGQTVEIPVTGRPSSQYQVVASDQPLQSDQGNMTEMPVTRPAVASTYGASGDDPGTAPSQSRVAAQQQNDNGASAVEYVDQSFPSPPGWHAIVDGAGNLVRWIQSAAQGVGQRISDAAASDENPSPEEQAQRAEVAGRRPDEHLFEPARVVAGTAPPVQSTPGEPDYVPRPGSKFGAFEDVDRQERIRQIQANAAAAQHITDPVRTMAAPLDPTWRSQNPDMAREYDDLTAQSAMIFGGTVGAGGEAPKPTPKLTVEQAQDALQVARQGVQDAQRAVRSAADRTSYAEAQVAVQQARQAEQDAVRQLQQAQQARQALEPAIRSDVGAKPAPYRDLRPDQRPEMVQDAVFPREVVRTNPADLSGPVGVPTDVGSRLNSGVGVSGRGGILPTVANAAQGGFLGNYAANLEDERRQAAGQEPMTPAERAAFIAGAAGLAVLAGRHMAPAEGRRLGSGVVPEGERPPARYHPELSQEPVLPGMEPPRRAPGDAGPSISNETGRPQGLRDYLANPEADVAFPGMEPPTAQRAPIDSGPPVSETPSGPRGLRDFLASPEADVALPGFEGMSGLSESQNARINALLSRAEQRSQRLAERGTTRPSAWDWIKQAGYSGIYSPATAVSSLISGAQELVMAQPKEAVRAIVQGRPGAYGRQVRAQIGALGESLPGLLRVLTGDAAESAATSGGSQGTAGLSDRVANPVGRFVARTLEKPGEILTEAPDAVFRPVFRAQGMQREASQVASEMGLRGPNASAYADRLMQDAQAVRGGQLPTLPETQRVIDAGEKYADELGYKGKPGQVGQYLSKLARRDDAIGVLASFLMPFPGMASRMTTAAIKSTPGAALIPAVRRGYPSKFDMVYDQTAGTLAAAGVGYWAMNGGITGSGPADKEKRDEMVALGWQPNSVLIGGHYIPNRQFGRFQPFLDTAGELHDALAYGKADRTAPQIASELVKRGSKIATDQIGLSGLADLHDMLESGFSSQFPGWAARSITRYLPYGGVLRSAAASLDPSQRRPDRWQEGSPLPAIGENLETAVPGLRQSVPAAQDVLGRPLENPQQGLGAFIPRTTTVKDDPTIKLFQDAGVDIGKARDQITVGRVSGVDLKPAEQRRWNELRGQFVQNYADAYTGNAEFMALPPVQKEKYLKTFLSKAADYADKMLQSEMDAGDLTNRATEVATKKAS